MVMVFAESYMEFQPWNFRIEALEAIFAPARAPYDLDLTKDFDFSRRPKPKIFLPRSRPAEEM